MTNDELARATEQMIRCAEGHRVYAPSIKFPPGVCAHRDCVFARALLRAAREKDEAERMAEKWKDLAVAGLDAHFSDCCATSDDDSGCRLCVNDDAIRQAPDPTPTPEKADE